MQISQNKDRILTVRVSHTQYEKICALADMQEINVTEYIRRTAIGNRIKPKVIEHRNDSKEVNDMFQKDNEELQKHIHQLEEEIDQMRQENNIFQHLLQYFDNTAFLNFNTYRDDRPLRNAIKRLKEQKMPRT